MPKKPLVSEETIREVRQVRLGRIFEKQQERVVPALCKIAFQIQDCLDEGIQAQLCLTLTIEGEEFAIKVDVLNPGTSALIFEEL